MATLKIEIDLDNAAFEDNALEASRILTVLAALGAERLQQPGTTAGLLDVNGNLVGHWAVGA